MGDNPFDSAMIEVYKRLEALEKGMNRGATLAPLFTVLNENSPAQLTADQNNYAPGDYDTLRMSTNATRTITGISGGVKGRRLTLLNVGSNSLNFVHQSASSDAANRIITTNAGGIALGAGDSVTFYYDSTDSRWRVLSLAT